MQSANNAVSLIDFSYQKFKNNSNNNVADFINEILLELVQIKDNVIAEINLRQLSICTGISFESIKNNFSEIVSRKEKRNQFKNTKSPQTEDGLSIEDDLLMLCFSKEKKIREEIYNNLNIDWMTSEQTKRIYRQIYIHLNSEFEPDMNVVLDQLESKEDHHKLASIAFEIDKIEPSVNMAKNCINRIQHLFLKKELEKYRDILKNEEASYRDNSDLIIKITEIQTKMNTIKDSTS